MWPYQFLKFNPVAISGKVHRGPRAWPCVLFVWPVSSVPFRAEWTTLWQESLTRAFLFALSLLFDDLLFTSLVLKFITRKEFEHSRRKWYTFFWLTFQKKNNPQLFSRNTNLGSRSQRNLIVGSLAQSSQGTETICLTKRGPTAGPARAVLEMWSFAAF